MMSQMNRSNRLSLPTIFVLGMLALVGRVLEVQAWGVGTRSASKRGFISMYMPSNGPTSSTPGLVAQRLMKSAGNPRVMELSPQSSLKLSGSALSSCDTLPSFPTSHGILSPETVLRLEDLSSRGHRSEALSNFLNTYRQHGPLSCLPMLSDPEVLPHLTAAMRDIAA